MLLRIIQKLSEYLLGICPFLGSVKEYPSGKEGPDSLSICILGGLGQFKGTQLSAMKKVPSRATVGQGEPRRVSRSLSEEGLTAEEATPGRDLQEPCVTLH